MGKKVKAQTGNIKDHLDGVKFRKNPNAPLNPNEMEESVLANRLAPIMKLHPLEKAFPTDPNVFIINSRLRTHRRGKNFLWKKDLGYNKVTNKWHKTNSKKQKYYNIPVNIINNWGIHGNNKNRRPRGKNSASRRVFLDPGKNIIKGNSKPNGEIPAYYHLRRENVGPNGSERILITYWVFFGNNPGLFGTSFFAHQGDWTRVTISVKPDSPSVEGIWFIRHKKKPKFVKMDELTFERGRPIVYLAAWSHGTYADLGGGIADLRSDKGIAWNISLNLLDLKVQPWRDYAGGWGEVGNLEITTGPLGPWHRRASYSF